MFIHAAGESSTGSLPGGTYAIALQARDETQLREISEQLTRRGIKHRHVIEDAAPYCGQLMALGCEPGPREVVGRWLASLPSAKG
jgi:DNA gyrase inhibitor GyrI